MFRASYTFALVAIFSLSLGSSSLLLAQAAPNAISRNLERKLHRDAARMALRLNTGEDLRFQTIRIPAGEMESIYKALLTMHNSDETIRSIFRCNVHTRPSPTIDHMIVIFDRQINWAKPLRAGRHETTSLTLNDLLYEHDLIIEKHFQWDDRNDAISIRSQNPLNMAALSNEFLNIEGVNSVDLGHNKDMGSDITASRMSKSWRFTFTLSFGSLQENGEKKHVWLYEYFDNGKFIKINENGDPVPEWMRCSIQSPLAFSLVR